MISAVSYYLCNLFSILDFSHIEISYVSENGVHGLFMADSPTNSIDLAEASA